MNDDEPCDAVSRISKEGKITVPGGEGEKDESKPLHGDLAQSAGPAGPKGSHRKRRPASVLI